MIQKSITVFKEFSKNPVVAMLFIALVAVGYLYWDVQEVYEAQIKEQKQSIKELKKELKSNRNKFENHLQSCEPNYNVGQTRRGGKKR
tara:strand:+ start:231 stop:494 length:264 start_codon:yes stop_codon:yes gene_type:complete